MDKKRSSVQPFPPSDDDANHEKREVEDMTPVRSFFVEDAAMADLMPAPDEQPLAARLSLADPDHVPAIVAHTLGDSKESTPRAAKRSSVKSQSVSRRQSSAAMLLRPVTGGLANASFTRRSSEQTRDSTSTELPA